MITTAAFLSLAIRCAPDIHPDTLTRIVQTESGFNPWAIGVVGTPLKQQPETKEEALRKVQELINNGKNFSIGLSQINRQHFDVNNPLSVFEPCNNLKKGAEIIKQCYSDALKESNSQQEALEKTFSCYYSGNFKRGFEKEKDGKSYVQRIVSVKTPDIKVPALDGSEPPDVLNKTGSLPVYEPWDVLRQYPQYKSTTPDKNTETSVVENSDEEIHS